MKRIAVAAVLAVVGLALWGLVALPDPWEFERAAQRAEDRTTRLDAIGP